MSRKRKDIAIHYHETPVVENGKWAKEIEEREVEVLAVVRGYAMVRRKGCHPYVARESELRRVSQ